MRTVKAIIERASDGRYSVYMDADDMDYQVTGTGSTVEKATRTFMGGYEDTKRYYAEEGKPFEEAAFEFAYDVPSFLQYYAKAFSLNGLAHITGINPKQLSHYVTGHRHPSPRTVAKIQDSIHGFAKELDDVRFV